MGEGVTLRGLAARVPALEARCGGVRLIAVDGHAGSGKTTFAGALAAELGGAPVVHTDDLATHEEPFEWMRRLTAEVLRPLAGGRPAVHRTYDWTTRRFAGEREIPAEPIILIEGVGSGRRALRPLLSLLLWLEVDAPTARHRGLLRDGPELARFWTGWTRAEDAHFAVDPSRPSADLLVHQTSAGYVAYPARPGALNRHTG